MASCTLRDVGVSCSSHKSGKCWAVSSLLCLLSRVLSFSRGICAEFDSIKPVTLQSRQKHHYVTWSFYFFSLCVIPYCSVHQGPVGVEGW